MSLRIAIIGAGMTGVSAGRLLADRGHRVTLLEKSRGCGGRCATKRWEGHTVDHGAQYFTLRHPELKIIQSSSLANTTLPICGRSQT